METPIHDFVVEQLQMCKGQLPRIAEESGVPYRTLQKVATQETKDPGVSIVQRLADYFRARTTGTVAASLPLLEPEAGAGVAREVPPRAVNA